MASNLMAPSQNPKNLNSSSKKPFIIHLMAISQEMPMISITERCSYIQNFIHTSEGPMSSLLRCLNAICESFLYINVATKSLKITCSDTWLKPGHLLPYIYSKWYGIQNTVEPFCKDSGSLSSPKHTKCLILLSLPNHFSFTSHEIPPLI